MKKNAFLKVKTSMARSLPVENRLPQNVGSIINNFQQYTEVAQWGAPICSRPQPGTDNGVRDGRSNWLVTSPTLYRAVPPELQVLHSSMQAANHKTYCTDWDANVRPSECQANALPVQPLYVWHWIQCVVQGFTSALTMNEWRRALCASVWFVT